MRFAKVVAIGLCLLAAAQDVGTDEEPDGDEAKGVHGDAPIEATALKKMHDKMDSNSDGKVSMDEVLKFATGMRHSIAQKDIGMVMESMDTDKSGKLSLEEVIKGTFDFEQEGATHESLGEIPQQKELEAEKFKAADTDHDGQLDVHELPGLFYPETNDKVLDLIVADILKRKDKDGDGSLSVHEFWGAEDKEKIEATEQTDFEKFDTDQSGKLSLAELKEWESGRFQTGHAMKKLFEVADKDGDMHVSVDELGQAGDEIVGTDAHYHMMEWSEHEL